MTIYTKTGDTGETSLFGGKRIAKFDPQVEAYGTVDELSSFLGLVLSLLDDKKDNSFLTEVQRGLYDIMAILANSPTDKKDLEQAVTEFEKQIDKIWKQLPPLNSFILPQGSQLSSWFHVLRTVCRRAERDVIKLFSQNKMIAKDNEIIVVYLNRLSDLFFAFARYYNRENEIKISRLKKI